MREKIVDRHSAAAIAEAERAGLKLAIKGRTLALLPLALWFALFGYFPRSLIGIGATLGFIALGLLHYFLIATRREKIWHRFVFVAIDAAALAAIAVNVPLSAGGDVPQIIVFRAYGVAYAFLILAVSTLSLSPLLVLWSGLCIVAALWTAFAIIVFGMSETLSWGALPENPTREQYLSVFLSPSFIGVGNRVEESLFLLGSAGILALAVQRARNLVVAEAKAQMARSNLARYLSPNLVERLANTPEPFGPVRRQKAAVLFIDIVGFTTFAEKHPPERVIAFLRDFHGRMGQIVFDHDGTLDDYVGDEIMAVFGTPETKADDAARAIACGRAMSAELDRWNTERASASAPPVNVGIGIHFGDVVVGATGNENRLKFAVVGDTVNVASRLQAATRELEARMIVSEEAAMSGNEAGIDRGRLVELVLRGHGAPVRAWTF